MKSLLWIQPRRQRVWRRADKSSRACATDGLLAEQAGADASLIVASLLHDYCHPIHNFGAGAARRGIDARHEVLGAGNLSAFFGEAVTMPVKLHVEAKRFLCASDAAYRGLSGRQRCGRSSLKAARLAQHFRRYLEGVSLCSGALCGSGRVRDA